MRIIFLANLKLMEILFLILFATACAVNVQKSKIQIQIVEKFEFKFDTKSTIYYFLQRR